MDSDWSVELGADDPALEMPWSDPDERVRYHDLRSQPESLLLIDEASRYRELGEFLAATNSSISAFETAKCDVWCETELDEAEEIYGASMKLASYVDVLFRSDKRFDFAAHEALVERLAKLLKKAPELASSAEFVVRRCFYHGGPAECDEGFYFTFYLAGYGDDETEARLRWGVGLKLVQNALVQVSAELKSEPRASESQKDT